MALQLSLGERLKLERERRRLHLTALAKRVEVSYQALHNIESGKTADPHWSIIVRIAEELGLSLDALAQHSRTTVS
jgi:transcriptional regulator with XRE-family HTH domain